MPCMLSLREGAQEPLLKIPGGISYPDPISPNSAFSQLVTQVALAPLAADEAAVSSTPSKEAASAASSGPFQRSRAVPPVVDPFHPNVHLPWHPEVVLLQITIELMNDQDINPHRGSVAIEKVQDVARHRHPQLVEWVLRHGGHRTFSAFVESHTEQFAVVQPASLKRRMVYLRHTDWMAADQLAREEYRSRMGRIEDALADFIRSLPCRCCTVDEFISAYPTLSRAAVAAGKPELPSLPMRGDFVKMIRRRRDIFEYNKDHFKIRLARQPPSAPAPIARLNFPWQAAGSCGAQCQWSKQAFPAYHQ